MMNAKTWRTAALALLALACLAGCSGDLLRIRRTGPPPLPEGPRRSYEHQMTIRELADWSARMLRKAQSEGAPQASPAVGQAAQAAEAVSHDAGPPAEPLPLPGPESQEPVPEAARAIERAGRQRRRYEQDSWRWLGELEDYAGRAVERQWRLGVPLLASVASLLALGAGAAFALKSALKWRRALWQVFLGVRGFLASPGRPEAADALKAELRGAMDESSRRIVDGLYRKTGDG
jgi:hypothetical protein